MAEDGESVILRIEDNGPGIAPDALPHLFTPFFSTRSRQESLGLGLTIARSMAREWDGELRLSSAPGRGATAELTLTLCAEITVPHRHLARFPSASNESRRAA